jgi:hypothetical protein
MFCALALFFAISLYVLGKAFGRLTPKPSKGSLVHQKVAICGRLWDVVHARKNLIKEQRILFFKTIKINNFVC